MGGCRNARLSHRRVAVPRTVPAAPRDGVAPAEARRDRRPREHRARRADRRAVPRAPVRRPDRRLPARGSGRGARISTQRWTGPAAPCRDALSLAGTAGRITLLALARSRGPDGARRCRTIGKTPEGSARAEVRVRDRRGHLLTG